MENNNTNEQLMKGANAGFHLRSVDVVTNEEGNPEFAINAVVTPRANHMMGLDMGYAETELPEYLGSLTKSQWTTIIQKFNECYDDASDLNNSSAYNGTTVSLIDNMRQLRDLLEEVGKEDA